MADHMAGSINGMDDQPPKCAKGNAESKHKLTQGKYAATVLTNCSNNQTVIRPFTDRLQSKSKAPSLEKGTRWMHRTTLTLERTRCTDPMESSMQFAYNGKNTASPPQRPARCPSLQESHIEIGMNEQLNLETHYSKEFPRRNIDHPNKIHYPSVINWSHNVTGQDMEDVLQRTNHKPCYWSSYTDVHSRLGLQQGEGVSRKPRPTKQYNILTGQETSHALKTSGHQLVSGNRVLSHAREHAGEGFILG